MGKIVVAMAQINSIVGDFDYNIHRIIESMKEAKSQGAEIIIFPELALCGYPPEDLLLKTSFLSDNLDSLNRVREACSGIIAVVGFAHYDQGQIYNAAALINNYQLIGVYHKIELPNYGVFDEKRYFRPGSGCLIFDLNNVRFCVTICEDIWIKGSPTGLCALENQAQIVLNLSASPFYAGKMEIRRKIVSDFSSKTKCTVFFNNSVGGQDELIFDGGSMVVDPSGQIIASAKRFEEDLLITAIDAPEHENQISWNTVVPLRSFSSLPASEFVGFNRIEPAYSHLEEVYHSLLLGTKDYVEKNGFNKVVIGLSGGIDSALTATLAVDALGVDQVIGVTIPSQYTSEETLSDAERVAENLGIKILKIPLVDIFDSYIASLKNAFGPGELGIEAENLQARIRGNILMALSNRFGWLVLTTGNKSETAVGYATLYGDMAGGFAVIKDVPKTLVYELADFINKKKGRDVIPDSTIVRAPTAELRPGQKDEDSLPPYSVLDAILKQYVEEDRSPDEIEGFPASTISYVIKLVDKNEYKRRQAPPGIKITPKAFGKDRRLPITNRYLASMLRSLKE